jgi:hypothetical protein
MEAASGRDSRPQTMLWLNYVSAAKQGARRRSLGLSITLPSRRQHRQRLSACTGCPARRWILVCNPRGIKLSAGICLASGNLPGPCCRLGICKQPAGSRTILLKLTPGVFAHVQFSRDSSSIVFLYHIGGCKAAGQAGAAGSTSAGSRQTWTYLFTVAADGSNLWRVPVCLSRCCNCTQLHSTTHHSPSMLCRAGRHSTAASAIADFLQIALQEILAQSATG